MIHVHVDRPDTALVRLDVRLAPVSTVSNIERQDLVLEMDYASSSFPIVLLSSPAFPFSENNFLPCLARYRVYLRNCLCLHHCLRENLYVSFETSSKPFGDLVIKILDASELSSTG